MEHVLIVMSEPVVGSEDEYHSWYSDTHLPEVVTTPGFKAAQRFRYVTGSGDTPPHQFLAIYEVEGDLEAAKAALAAGRPNRTPTPDAMAAARTSWWFTRMTDRVEDAAS